MFLASNSGRTGPGQNMTINVSSNITYSTSQSNTFTIGYSGGLVVTGGVTSTSSTTITNGASASTTIGENSSATISLYQKKAVIYYGISYIAPTFVGDPIATPVLSVYTAGSCMTSMYVSKVTE